MPRAPSEAMTDIPCSPTLCPSDATVGAGTHLPVQHVESMACLPVKTHLRPTSSSIVLLTTQQPAATVLTVCGGVPGPCNRLVQRQARQPKAGAAPLGRAGATHSADTPSGNASCLCTAAHVPLNALILLASMQHDGLPCRDNCMPDIACV